MKHTLLGGIALGVGLGGDERGKSQRGESLDMHDYGFGVCWCMCCRLKLKKGRFC